MKDKISKSKQENKTRIKISEFYKWHSSNTVDIKLGRRYLVEIL